MSRGLSTLAKEAAARGAAWLAGRANEDGSLGSGAGIRTMYKALAALAVSGQESAAGRLADWLKTCAQRRPGVFEHPDAHAPPNQNLYTDCWILLGAQRLGRADLASREALDRVAAEQSRWGGFSMAPASAEVRFLDPTSTALAGMVLLRAGHLDQAQRAGGFLVELIERQPEVQQRFWFQVHPDDGQLVTSAKPNEAILSYVDYQVPKQLFFHLGVPAVLLCELAAATREDPYCRAAERYAETAGRICEPGRSFTCACKCAWGVARCAGLTGEPRWQELCRSFSQAVFLDRQLADGGWPEPTIPLSDDGTVSRTLTREEITAEFTYELAAIADALDA